MRRIVIPIVVAAVALSCSAYDDTKSSPDGGVIVKTAVQGPQIIGADVPEEYLVPGKIIIKVTEEYSNTLESLADGDGIIETAATKAAGIGNITRMRRLFPYAGRFEERTRKEGMHLWYVAEYDKDLPATKAAGSFVDMAGVSVIEYTAKAALVGNVGPAVYCELPASPSAKHPFNDPGFGDQWHYYNDGGKPNSRLGCDIGVLKAWDYVVGNPDVVVCVVDEGVDYTHEDLADNMWHNPEKSGEQQYGYNFVKNSYTVTIGEHGTHVAGTIAAVNNNGKGVCGIAGGDAKAGKPGVKIMSCQIFEGNDDGGIPETAIKWGADHGAVICQNSWNYEKINYVPSSTKAAIDYFVKYAGVDENGNQTGPIKGGLVFFSAGNENTNYGSPSSYDQVTAVAAVGADYEKAYYSNYGSWVDIAAPGGDAEKGNYVYSTLPNNQYGYFQGTSMACPHASGAAALLVSLYGREGTTPDMIKKRMLENTLDISTYNTKKIGAGLLKVSNAIFDEEPENVAPDKVTRFSARPRSNYIDVELTIPSDRDDENPSLVMVYVSRNPISEQKDVDCHNFVTGSKVAGDTFECTVSGLDFDTDYHVAVAVADKALNISELSDEVVVRTESNNPPEIVITGQAEGMVLRYNQEDFIDFSISDPDGHSMEARLEGLPGGTSIERSEKDYRIRINANLQDPGQYRGQLVVTDEYGASSRATIGYTILENRPPEVTAKLESIVFNGLDATPANYTLNQFFADKDEEMLRYSVTISQNIAKVSCQDGHLTINPVGYGYADVTVKASDSKNANAAQNIRILVRDGRSALDIYPNPVRTTVNFRTAEPQNVDLKIVSASGAEVYSASRNISPFEPLSLDLSGIPAGSYTVKAKMGGKTITETLIKL